MPVARFRESIRSAIRECLVFILFGAAFTAIAFNSALDGMGLRGETSSAIAFLLIFGALFGIPAWIVVRILLFAFRG
jgi:hypothetical protein